MVVDGIVEPGRVFCRGVFWSCENGCIWEANGRIKVRKNTGAGIILVVENHTIGIPVWEISFAAVGKHALFIGDDISGMVYHNVKEHLHISRMSIVNEILHLLIGAEMGINLSVINLPVPVIGTGRTTDGAIPLDGFIGKLWRHPDG